MPLLDGRAPEVKHPFDHAKVASPGLVVPSDLPAWRHVGSPGREGVREGVRAQRAGRAPQTSAARSPLDQLGNCRRLRDVDGVATRDLGDSRAGPFSHHVRRNIDRGLCGRGAFGLALPVSLVPVDRDEWTPLTLL